MEGRSLGQIIPVTRDVPKKTVTGADSQGFHFLACFVAFLVTTTKTGATGEIRKEIAKQKTVLHINFQQQVHLLQKK